MKKTGDHVYIYWK